VVVVVVEVAGRSTLISIGSCTPSSYGHVDS
jgi:hypothetical protein